MPATRKSADAGMNIARAALLEQTDASAVGDHVGMQLDDSGLIIHEFACLLPGYPNWNWTVVLSHDPGNNTLGVCDAVLLPTEGALVPPAWVPWSSRVQPGDLRPGDVLPSDPNDARLMPGYASAELRDTEAPDVLEAVWEFGLGRERVLSADGRESTSYRWWRGETGPSAPDARLAPHPCSTCGFFVGIKGGLGAAFGVCTNEISPADGRVVSVAFGCGAHSGIVIAPAVAALPEVTLDENEYEIFDRTPDPEVRHGERVDVASSPQIVTEQASPAPEASVKDADMTAVDVTESSVPADSDADVAGDSFAAGSHVATGEFDDAAVDVNSSSE